MTNFIKAVYIISFSLLIAILLSVAYTLGYRAGIQDFLTHLIEAGKDNLK